MRWSLKINPLSQTPLCSRTVSHRILPEQVLKQAKSALLKSNIVILLLAWFSPLRIPNSTISWLLQSSHPTFRTLTASSVFNTSVCGTRRTAGVNDRTLLISGIFEPSYFSLSQWKVWSFRKPLFFFFSLLLFLLSCVGDYLSVLIFWQT